MEAVVDQALGNVLDVHPRRRLEGPCVDDAFVRDQAALAPVEQVVVAALLEPFRDVVRVEDRDLRRERETLPAHHRDVCPRDRQDGGAPPRSRGNGARALGEGNADIDDRMCG